VCVSLKPRDELNLRLFVGMLENFRKLDTEMPIQYAVSFLMVGLHEGQEGGFSVTDLEHRINLSQSATSRNVQALSKVLKRVKGGNDILGRVVRGPLRQAQEADPPDAQRSGDVEHAFALLGAYELVQSQRQGGLTAYSTSVSGFDLQSAPRTSLNRYPTIRQLRARRLSPSLP
jgi:hypothetical protein